MKEKIIGIYSPSKSGDFGFVDIEGEEKGYYVHFLNKKNALPGDKVLAKIKVFKGKKEAVIEKILERNDKIFIGIVVDSKKEISKKNKKEFTSFAFVKIKDENFKKDVFIPGKYIKNAKNGDLVGVQIISWDNGKSPKGKIVQILGDSKNEDLIIEALILEAGFKQEFSKSIINYLNKIPKKIDYTNRKNLKNLFTYTIDGEDAKDLDDAISIKKRKSGNYELFIHIADVSQYIKENSILDKEALERSTSVYLVDRVIPMLPQKLSNDLCSLNLKGEKLSLTCEILVDKNGIIKKSKVYESIIESNFRLTYKEVDSLKNNLIKENDILFCKKKITKELIENIGLAWELKEKIEKNRENIGVINFDFSETKIVLDENKNVVKIEEYPRYESNKLIELFMVSANYSISKLFKDLPFLYRIHPKPSYEDIEKLKQVLNLFGIKFEFKTFSTKEYQKLLEIIQHNPNKEILEKSILRSLSKAIYSEKNEGHFGLGLDYYSHFTSPIRRYPDLQIHRIIKEKINKKLNKKRINHYYDILEKIAKITSEKERQAEQLEYKVKDYYIAKYYKDKVGQSFEAKVSGIINKGIFVMLKDTAEGFIDFEKKSDYIYNEDFMLFENKKNNSKIKIGDKIEVKLIEVDMQLFRLYFEKKEG